MKAIRVHEPGGPEVLRFEEAPPPEPREREVRIRIHAAGVNPVDTYVRSGAYTKQPRMPYVPGIDGAGIVDAVGAEARRFRAGDRVYVDGSRTGTYAELTVVAEEQAHPLPERVSFAAGAALGVPYTTAYRGIVQCGRAMPGETLLVHGATGGVGIAAVQWGRAHGLFVIGTGGTPEGRDLVRREGAHEVLDHHSDGHADEIRRLTGGRGVDVVLEMLANVNLERDLELVAVGGRVVVVGSRGRIEIDPRAAMTRDASVIGVSLFNTPAVERARIHAAMVAGLEAGTLRPVVAAELPLAAAAEAHRRVLEPGARGKIVLVP
jgi:NADPH:quinone reductase